MKDVIRPKKIHIKRHFMTFFSKTASGTDSPTTAIINASAVPTGIPLATKTSIMGTMLRHLNT